MVPGHLAHRMISFGLSWHCWNGFFLHEKLCVISHSKSRSTDPQVNNIQLLAFKSGPLQSNFFAISDDIGTLPKLMDGNFGN
jgi:hypothetical protein